MAARPGTEKAKRKEPPPQPPPQPQQPQQQPAPAGRWTLNITVGQRGRKEDQSSSSSSSSSATSTIQQAVPVLLAPPTSGKVPGERRLVVVRNGERVDTVFPDWVQLAFAPNRGYLAYDLNMPITVADRPRADWANDPPMTELGQVTAGLVARGIDKKGLVPDVIYTSPALRCVQTAVTIARNLQTPQPVPIRIEPGLFEWMYWNSELPCRWLSTADLSEFFKGGDDMAGNKVPPANIDDDYAPVLSRDKLVKSARKETAMDHYKRVENTLRHVLARLAEAEPHMKDILVVGHPSTFDGGLRALCKPTNCKQQDDPTARELDQLGSKYPHGCAVVVAQQSDTHWAWAASHDIPPATASQFSTKVDYAHFARKLAGGK